MEAEVLGVVTWTGRRKMERKEQDRVERAKKMAARIAVMPGARERKRMAYRSYGAPVQAYGWIAKGMPAGEEGKATTAALRAVSGKAHKLGSRNLKKILDGAALDPRCLQPTKLVKIIEAAAKRGRTQDRNRPGTISATMRSYMKTLGWKRTGEWTWTRERRHEKTITERGASSKKKEGKRKGRGQGRKRGERKK